MTQVVSNKTGRKKIVKASGENTEIKITAKKFSDYLEIRTDLKLNSEHKFKEDYQITIQPYESKGFARQPMDMGTVGNPSDLSFTLDDISLDTLLFRLKVVDKHNTVKGFADEIKPDLSGGGDDTSEGGDGSNTILPIKEDASIKLYDLLKFIFSNTAFLFLLIAIYFILLRRKVSFNINTHTSSSSSYHFHSRLYFKGI